ncbi:MAG: DUF4868 domain-containing protein [Spirochaetaceae bacterium]
MDQVLDNLKEVNWHDAKLTFFIVKRTLRDKKAKYSIKELKLERDLHFKLKGITTNKIYYIKSITDLKKENNEEPNNALVIENSETDFDEILQTINSTPKPELAITPDELLGSWFYVARLIFDDQELYSVRKVSAAWNTKKVRQFANTVLTDNMLVDLDEKEVFKLDGDIDFISFKKQIFITNKHNFKSALNYRG